MKYLTIILLSLLFFSCSKDYNNELKKSIQEFDIPKITEQYKGWEKNAIKTLDSNELKKQRLILFFEAYTKFYQSPVFLDMYKDKTKAGELRADYDKKLLDAFSFTAFSETEDLYRLYKTDTAVAQIKLILDSLSVEKMKEVSKLLSR